ncbi:MAG TPA: hypothetical protein VMT03_17395 [Polyangia bacterium]|nr:hypothetical protein [Polyangia bacterium]
MDAGLRLMNFDVEYSEADPDGAMQRLVLPWLSKDHWSTKDLLGWIAGRGLPPVSGDEEPYVWILQGLPLGAQRHAAERELAGRLAASISELSVTAFSSQGDSKLSFGLLMTAASLGCPEELSAALRPLFERGVSGEWNGIPISDALVLAVAGNQLDNTLLIHWKRYLLGETTPVPGSPEDGLLGILLMPASAEARDRPSLEALQDALTCVVRWFDSAGEPDRVDRLRALSSKVEATYPGLKHWASFFAEVADRDRWPSWTRAALNGPAKDTQQKIFGRSAEKIYWPRYVEKRAE